MTGQPELSPRERAAVKQVASAVTWANEDLELTYEEVGQALGGASPRTVSRWLGQETRPHPPAVIAAETLLAVANALDAVFGKDHVRMQEWLHEPVRALGGRTPLRTIIAGDAGEVLTLIANVDAGAFM